MLYYYCRNFPNGQPDFPNMLILQKLGGGGLTTPPIPPRYGPADDKRLAELLVIRSEEFVNGLIMLDRLALWSEEVHQRFQTVIECFNEQLGIINEPALQLPLRKQRGRVQDSR